MSFMPSSMSDSATSTSELSNAEIYRTIEDLVGFSPRSTGSTGGRRAAEYVAARLSGAGVPDVQVMTAPSYEWSADGCSLEIDDQQIPCSPMLHSCVASDGQVGTLMSSAISGKIIDIGDGEVPADARGAVILFDLVFEMPLKRMLWLSEYRHDPYGMFKNEGVRESRNPFQTSMTRIMRSAHAAGAVAAIGVLRDYPESSNYRNEYFADEPMAIPGVWVTRSMGERIRAGMLRSSTAAIDMRITRKEVMSRTVIGILPGQSSDAIMIQSHHDSVTPGAVEDASGAAEVIALAEEFAATDISARKKTLMFVSFDTHFTGYHAHRKFIQKYVVNTRRSCEIVFNVTIEHVGLRAVRSSSGEFRLTGESESRGIFENLSIRWKWRLARLMRTHGMTGTSLLCGTPLEFSDEGIPTDAAYTMSAGIPTVSLIAGPLYLYDDADTLDKVDYSQLVNVAEFFSAVVRFADAANPNWIGFIPRPLRRILPSRRWVTDAPQPVQSVRTGV